MKNFLRRLGRTLADILTSKKALATIGAVVARKTGADPLIVQAVIGYVVAQGIADHGKEAAKKQLRGKNGELIDTGADLAAGTLR